jgi:hypothetical protein
MIFYIHTICTLYNISYTCCTLSTSDYAASEHYSAVTGCGLFCEEVCGKYILCVTCVVSQYFLNRCTVARGSIVLRNSSTHLPDFTAEISLRFYNAFFINLMNDVA